MPDSRSTDSPWFSESLASSCGGKFLSPLLVIGGRLRVGLDCLTPRGDFAGRGMPGEWDDMEVGVEVLLKPPGDSDRRVEDPLLCAKLAVGGDRFRMDNGSGVDRGLYTAIRELDVA